LNPFSRVVLAAVVLFAAVPARAELLVGIASIANHVGPNLEWAGDRSSFYLVPGLEAKKDGLTGNKVRWVAGMRHRLERGLMSSTGFYTGLTVGDLGGENNYERLGAGGELGYQWVKEYTRMTMGASLVVLEAVPEQDLKEEPSVVLGITLSLRK